jgi:hypothetical protein
MMGRANYTLIMATPESPGGGSEGAPQPTVAQPSPAPAPPPAASVVATGTRTEQEVQLSEEIERLRGSLATTELQKKDREQRINQLEDELRRLTTPPRPPKEKPFVLGFSFGDDD